MRYASKLFIILFVVSLAVLSVLLVLSLPASSAGSVPDVVPPVSAEETSTAPPAGTEVVVWAKRWRRAAIRAWLDYNEVRAAFRWKPVKFNKSSAGMPARSLPAATWMAAGRAWKHDRAAYRYQRERLLARMTSTKGGGALRWRPLIRYVWPEWSEGQVYLMAHIVWHESSGRPFAWNGQGSGAFGLFQLLPKPPGVWGPLSQALAARWKYLHGGLAHWAGCRAFSCPGGCGIY